MSLRIMTEPAARISAVLYEATILKHYSHMFVGDEQMLLDVLEDDDM